MRKKLYYYPSATRNGYPNPYSNYYKKSLLPYFEVMEKDNIAQKIKGVTLLKRAFEADVIILNWIESIGFLRYGFFQFLLAILSFYVMRWRNVKIVWMFHNIHPHQGENFYSRRIQKKLFKIANLIISHSSDAAKFASLYSKSKIVYICHPIHSITLPQVKLNIHKIDVFIWGAILPYKGVYEFISQKTVQNSNLQIYILGKCNDRKLEQSILNKCNEHITFENRCADFSEIAAYCKNCRYVLFPYIGECVSSSGALMDTIMFDGLPIGPRKGAFKDLEQEGVCITYENYDDLLRKLMEESEIKNSAFIRFKEKNSWEEFARKIYHLCNL